MDDIAKLFGSGARVKLLRLFYFNADMAFSVAEASERSRLSPRETRKELANLVQSKALRKRSGGNGKFIYSVNPKFRHLEPLSAFLRDTTDIKDETIALRLKKAGTIKVIALSGLFTGAQEPQIDMLIVGDLLSERAIAHAVHTLEAELGRELRYASFSTEDFRYRMGVYDRLVRDMFDYSHRLIVDKIGLK